MKQISKEQTLVERENLPTFSLPEGGCIIEKMVGRWGPYYYHVVKRDGKQTWTYLGKNYQPKEQRVGKKREEEAENNSVEL